MFAEKTHPATRTKLHLNQSVSQSVAAALLVVVVVVDSDVSMRLLEVIDGWRHLVSARLDVGSPRLPVANSSSPLDLSRSQQTIQIQSELAVWGGWEVGGGGQPLRDSNLNSSILDGGCLQ